MKHSLIWLLIVVLFSSVISLCFIKKAKNEKLEVQSEMIERLSIRLDSVTATHLRYKIDNHAYQ